MPGKIHMTPLPPQPLNASTSRPLGPLSSVLGLIVVLLGICALPAWSDSDSPYDRLREKMVTEQIEGRGVSSPDVLAAMRKVERHRFVPEARRDQAYSDYPLPIGDGQTISQPYIVALMTWLVEPGRNARILEIGTGSGYQAAVLAETCAEVYTVEIIPELGGRAEKLLSDLGYRNIRVKIGDGYEGWPEHAPFDGIIVTCAPSQIPQPLKDQLAEGGRLVIPVGPQDAVQHLKVLVKVKGKIADPGPLCAHGGSTGQPVLILSSSRLRLVPCRLCRRRPAQHKGQPVVSGIEG
jgi:protein-L-isoaspartate(D-aspartate) O-methyltransferase